MKPPPCLLSLQLLFTRIGLFGAAVAATTAGAALINVPGDQPTIQAAITAASSGDTIQVAPGTYVENLTLSKKVTLKGAKAGFDARGRVVGAANPAVESIISPAVANTALLDLNTGCAQSVIDGFVFSGGGGAGTIGAIRSSTGPIDYIQIRNNHIAGFSDAAIWFNRGGIDVTLIGNVMDGSSLTAGSQIIFLNGPQTFAGLWVVNNWIKNGGTRYGLFVDGNRNVGASVTPRSPLIRSNAFTGNSTAMNIGKRSMQNGEISGNTFSNNTLDGLQGGPKDTLIKGNSFSNNGRSGLALTSFSDLDPLKGAQGNTVTMNLFASNVQEGIFLSAGQAAGTMATNTVNNNNIAGNTVGLTYNGSEVINAENNWWGNATGPTHSSNGGGTGDTITNASGSVDFTPWLNAELDLSPKVYVDQAGDYVSTYDTDGSGDLSNGDLVTWNPTGADHSEPATPNLTFGVDAFTTLQAAVNAASPGSRILAAAGTYAEGVTVNKAVRIQGAQAGVDARMGRPGANETIVSNAGGAFALSADNIVLDGVVIEGQTNGNAGPGWGYAIFETPGFNGRQVRNCIVQNNIVGMSVANAGGAQAVIQNNLFKNNNNTGPATGQGIYQDEYTSDLVDNVLIDSNQFEGHTNGGIGFSSVTAAKPAQNITVSNNVFSANARALYAFNLQNSQIIDNVLINSDWAASADLRLFEGCTNLTITGNDMQDGAGYALRVSNAGTGLTTASNITFNRNRVTNYGKPDAVANSGYTGVFDASANYWGTSDTTVVAAKVSGSVDFTPVLDNGESLANQAITGFQADLSSLTAHTLGGQSGATARIAEALDLVTSGGTVNLAAGTYTEDVAINQPVTLAGAQAGINPNDAGWNDSRTNAANESIIRGAVNLSLRNEIVVDGFTFERTASNEGHVLIGAGQPYGSGATSKFDIKNNRFIGTRSTGTTWAGIHTNFLNDVTLPGAQFTALQNRFQVAGTASGAGILVNNNNPGSDNLASTTITGNYVTSSPSNGFNVNRPGVSALIDGNHVVNDDIFTFRANNTVISNNTISDSPQAAISNTGGSTNWTASNNTIINPRAQAVRVGSIFTADPVSGVTISGNTITVDPSLVGVGVTVPASPLQYSFFDITGNLTGANQISSNTLMLGANPLNPAAVSVYGVKVTGASGSVGNLSVINNVLDGNNVGGAGTAALPPSSGLFLDTNLLTASLNLNVQNNAIVRWPNNISIFDTDPGGYGGLAAGATVTLFGNDLSGYGNLGVASGAGEIVNASANWWGTNVAIGQLPSVSGNVDFTPMLFAATDTDGAVGFQGDFTGLIVTYAGSQTGPMTRPDEATSLLTPGGTVYEAEIAVEKPGAVNLVDGVSVVDFGRTFLDAPNSLVFTLKNTGNFALTGFNITIDGADASAFSVTAAPVSPVSGASSTTFTVTFAPSTDGVKTAAIHIGSSDGDENPFDIDLTGRGAIPATALALDGVDDRIEIAAHADFNPPGGLFTIEGWVKPETGMATWARLFGTELNRGDLIIKTGSLERFSFYPVINGAFVPVTSPTNWTSGVWYHVAGVVDQHTVRLFVDGIEVASAEYTGTWTSDPGVRYIGRSVSPNAFRGVIDDVRIWNYARNCDQISQARDGELTGLEPGLIAYYNFNQGEASGDNMDITQIIDSANNGDHPGIISGFALSAANSTSNFITPSILAKGVLADPPLFAEIDVQGNGLSIWSGDTNPTPADHTDFGKTSIEVTRTFTIVNNGTIPLELDDITLSGPNAPAFTLGNFTPNTTLAAGGDSTTFTITIGPSSGEARYATVNIANNDCNEGSYSFAIRSVPAYLITTTGDGIVVTDTLDDGGTVAMSQSAAGNVSFSASGRLFSVDGSDNLEENSGAISLTGKTSITINGSKGSDTISFGAFTDPLPNLTIDGGTGDDTINFNGDIAFAENAILEVIDEDTPSGADTVNIAANANVIASGTGTITIIVTRNVTVAAGGSLQTGDGNLTIEANQQAAPTAGNFVGVNLSGALARIESAGAGAVTVKGRGGDASSGIQIGVRVQGGAKIVGGISTPLNVEGSGGNSTGGSNFGVNVTGTGSAITSNGCDVVVTGHDGGGTSGIGIFATASGSFTTAANGGAIKIVSNSIHFDGTVVASTASNEELSIVPFPGVGINLGASTNPLGGPVSLTDVELDRISTGTLNIGDVSSGPITQSTAITRPASTHINLMSGAAIGGTVGPLNSAGGNVNLNAGGPTNTISPSAYGVDVNAGASTLSFGSGDKMQMAITSYYVDSGYRQLNVVGQVNLSNVTLLLSGTHVPLPGQTFTIVNNDLADPVIGMFTGLAQGATVMLNNVPLTISYTGGSGNDVTLGYAKPVITASKASMTVNEGSVATNTGTFSDLQGNNTVTLTATSGGNPIGNLQTNSNAGTWSWSYTPPDGPLPSQTVTITATDNSTPPLVTTKTFTYAVNNVTPVASAQTLTVFEDSGATTISLGAADPGADDLTFTIVTPPLASKGSLSPVSGNQVAFTPAANFAGSASFTFKVTDSDGAVSATVPVTINVTGINDAPTFVKGANKVHPAGTSAAQTFAGWATAINDGDAEVTQSLAFTVTQTGGPAIFTTPPAIGSTGTLTYQPNGTLGTATLEVTLKDTGLTANGGTDTSIAQSFTITVAPFSPGTFTGLALPDTGVNQNNLGLFSGTLTATGSFSGKVNFAGTTPTFTAIFDLSTGNSVGDNSTATTSSTLEWNLHLDVTGTTDKITGTISKVAGAVVTDVCDVDADRATFSAGNPVAAEYRNGSGNATFTVAFAAKTQNPPLDPTAYPQGFGIGTITVTPAGAVTISGTLADGTLVTASAPMSKTYGWPLAIIIKSTESVAGMTLGGMVQFNASDTNSDLSASDLLWFRPAFESAPSYDDGWPQGIAVDAVGCRYNSALTVQESLGLGDPDPDNGMLMFTDGKLITDDITITNFKIVGSTVTKNPPATNTYTLVVAQGYGNFNGTFTPDWPSPSATKPSFKGIILQKGLSKGGFGFFLSNADGDTNPASGAATLGAP